IGVKLQLPNGSIVSFASQADADLFKTWWQNNQTQQVQTLSGGGGGGGGGGILGPPAGAGPTLGGFLSGRHLRNKLADAEDARARVKTARDKFAARAASDPALQPLLEYIDAAMDQNDAELDALDTQITAVDISAGAGAVRLINDFTTG